MSINTTKNTLLLTDRKSCKRCILCIYNIWAIHCVWIIVYWTLKNHFVKIQTIYGLSTRHLHCRRDSITASGFAALFLCERSRRCYQKLHERSAFSILRTKFTEIDKPIILPINYIIFCKQFQIASGGKPPQPQPCFSISCGVCVQSEYQNNHM